MGLCSVLVVLRNFPDPLNCNGNCAGWQVSAFPRVKPDGAGFLCADLTYCAQLLAAGFKLAPARQITLVRCDSSFCLSYIAHRYSDICLFATDSNVQSPLSLCALSFL